jgi:beta-carotene 15,15'-dioxygenase
MTKIHNLSIVLSFFGLWITSMFSGELEIILGFILIFSFGILHGSNDILLINSISNAKTTYPFFRVLGTYILTVLSAVIIFYFLPLVGLTLFILFSAYHFGEQHWENRLLNKNQLITNLYYIFYGLFILMLVFVFNKQEVIAVIKSITLHQLTTNTIDYYFVATSIIFLFLFLYEIYHSKKFRTIFLLEIFYLIIFTIIFKVSTLIWGFTIYFILWHSIPSLFEQITFIYGDFNKKNILNYLKNAVPYWLISIIGLMVVFQIFKEEKLLYAIVFSFIAAVTFPHSLVINKMFKHKKTQPN